MRPEQYIQLLEDEIAALDSQMKALNPSWEVPSLQCSYTESAVHGAVLGVYTAA